MIRNQVSNLYPSAKVDTVNLVDFQCNANWRVYTQNHGAEEALQKHLHHHISSHIITSIITSFTSSPDFQATTTGKPVSSQAEPHTAWSWQPPHDHHEGNVGSGQKPVLTQDGPCWPWHIHGKLRTIENPVKSTYIMSSLMQKPARCT